MMCTNCGQAPASFFFTQSFGGRETTVALCANCAKKAGFGSLAMTSPLFGSFLPQEDTRRIRQDSGKRCPLCGQTFDDILAAGKVGCPKCYDAFRDELRDTIRSIHGTARHVGMTPAAEAESPNVSETAGAPEAAAAEKAKASPARTEEEILRDELDAAVKAENYEYAAKLRDRIRALKGESNA